MWHPRIWLFFLPLKKCTKIIANKNFQDNLRVIPNKMWKIFSAEAGMKSKNFFDLNIFQNFIKIIQIIF